MRDWAWGKRKVSEDNYRRNRILGVAFLGIVLLLVARHALKVYSSQVPAVEDERRQFHDTGRQLATELAFFRTGEGCFPHAQDGLRLVISTATDPVSCSRNPDGSVTAPMPHLGPLPPADVDCYYLNPAAGTLGDPTNAVVLAVLGKKGGNRLGVIDSSCACHQVLTNTPIDPQTLLGLPVAELAHHGTVVSTRPMPRVQTDFTPAPWQPTCDKEMHLPWSCE